MNYLCITVRWFDDRYHGKDGDGEPEWPPSPLRLFQAMLAGAYRRFGETDSFLASFRWLQSDELAAPIIVAPRTQQGQPLTRFVPNNDSDKDFNRQDRLTAKVVRPTLLLDPSPIHYLWQLPEPFTDDARSHVNELADIARSVVAFGWGVDMATACGAILSETQANSLSGERWSPSPRITGTRRRVPGSTTLDALIERQELFVGRLRIDQYARQSDNLRNGCLTDLPPLDESAFRRVSYAREQDRPQRAFAEFVLRHSETNQLRTFRATQTAKVAAMVRHAVGEVAKPPSNHTEPGVSPAQWLDQYVHGHNRTNNTTLGRFTYMPLPTIDPRGVAGGVRRVLIAEPTDGLGQHAAWAKRMLSGQSLVNLQTQCEEAFLAPAAANDSVVSRYVSHSREWATVTPVVLPWGDSGKPHRAEKQFLKALRHAGYSAADLDDLDLRREPFWRGTELARQYFVPKHLQGTASWHVRLRWKHDFAGPLAIGSGRFCGLGVFAIYG